MPVTAELYQTVALQDPESNWELHQGRLREKPSMTFAHNDIMFFLGHLLQQQLDRGRYRVRVNAGRVRHSDVTYYIPDVFVIPIEFASPFRDRADVLEVYDRPLPFVAEVWSPSTGEYDVDTKLPEYQRRGDLEIWRLHPFDRTLTAWRLQPGQLRRSCISRRDGGCLVAARHLDRSGCPVFLIDPMTSSRTKSYHQP